MIFLNENAVKYINNMGFSDIVVDVIKFTSWCAPPKMEMSVGFADKGKDANYYIERGYRVEESELGKV